jgi:hypothetical protein
MFKKLNRLIESSKYKKGLFLNEITGPDLFSLRLLTEMS